MALPRDLVSEYPALGEWSILLGWRGSIAHGMYTPSDDPDSFDDKDVHGVCVPPRPYYLGLSEFGSRGTQEVKRDEWDVVTFEARKAIRLLAKGNPNILSLLWMPENMYLDVKPAGAMLLAERDLFLGRHVYFPFVGYATAQFQKMTRIPTKLAYMGEKRAQLVEKYGYDTKNASHLIRLLRMAIEWLRDGELHVHRHDAPELMAIKRGEWKLEQVKSEAARLRKLADDAYAKSDLPARPDPDAVNDLCVRVVERAWHGYDRETASAYWSTA